MTDLNTLAARVDALAPWKRRAVFFLAGVIALPLVLLVVSFYALALLLRVVFRAVSFAGRIALGMVSIHKRARSEPSA
jgi:hypothetical protein